MTPRALRGRGLLVGVVTAYTVAACAGLVLLLWSGLAPAERATVTQTLRGQAVALFVGGALVVAGLGWLLQWSLGRYAAALRRLTGDILMLLDANPDHRLDPAGPAEVAALTDAVGKLAERRRVAEREVTRQADAARAEVEQERNRLAALMAELAVAVVVCTLDGRILLYNAAARSVLGDDPAIGLGRSVFGLVDRGLIGHALDRVRAGAPAHVTTLLRDKRLLQISLAPVRGPQPQVAGFVLVLEDQTSRVRAGARRDAVLRALSEGTRASLGSIRAAIENVLDYPDMAAEDRRGFVEIVREESERLGSRIERWVSEYTPELGEAWLLTEVSGVDLLGVLATELERTGEVGARVRAGAEELWLKVDSHAVARAVVHLAGRIRDECGADALTLSLVPTGRHARLDVRWHGHAPDAGTFRGWLDEALTGGGAASVRDVVERHGGEAWCTADPDGWAQTSMLLPLAEAVAPPPVSGRTDTGSRPEFYDFDLLDQSAQSPGWQERKLSELAYTVFDTETTGLDATSDEIISIGAVRVVNGRILRSESFERLVDPGRPVPARAVAVHGISSEMVLGQPRIDEVLPLFARYAEETVLVGHNVSFDLRLLRAKEHETGVRFAQPVLDTLLLDAAIHADHEGHSLEAIAARLGVEPVGRHTAGGDALITAQVFLRLVSLLQHRGIETLGGALAASRVTMHARLDRSRYGVDQTRPR